MPRMRLTRLALAALATLATLAVLPRPAAAQVQVNIRIGLPPLPALVVVQPGVQVVQDFDDEVFVHGGVYYARRGEYWYRGRGPQAEFVRVETHLVPEPLRRLPPGHYRRYHPPPPPRAAEHKPDKKEEKAQRKEEDRERKEREHGQDGKHDHDHHDGRER